MKQTKKTQTNNPPPQTNKKKKTKTKHKNKHGLSKLRRTNSSFYPSVSFTQQELQRTLEMLISKLINISWKRVILVKARKRVKAPKLTAFVFVCLILQSGSWYCLCKKRRLFKGESHAAFYLSQCS